MMNKITARSKIIKNYNRAYALVEAKTKRGRAVDNFAVLQKLSKIVKRRLPKGQRLYVGFDPVTDCYLTRYYSPWNEPVEDDGRFTKRIEEARIFSSIPEIKDRNINVRPLWYASGKFKRKKNATKHTQKTQWRYVRVY